MKEREFDPAKPVQTRDGYPARILCTDFKSPIGRTMLVAVQYAHGEEAIDCFPNGTVLRGFSDLDIVNVPERVEGYVNVYQCDLGYHFSEVYKTREAADMYEDDMKRVACIYVQFEEGEGLE